MVGRPHCFGDKAEHGSEVHVREKGFFLMGAMRQKVRKEKRCPQPLQGHAPGAQFPSLEPYFLKVPTAPASTTACKATL